MVGGIILVGWKDGRCSQYSRVESVSVGLDFC